MNHKLMMGVSLAAAIYAVPALAVPTTCSGYATTVINGWSDCAGFYDMNVFSNSSGDVAKQQEAVTYLGGSFDGDFNSLFGFGNLSNGSNGERTIELGRTLTGVNIIGVHFGNIGLPNDQYGNVSAFYKFDFGSTGVDSLTFAQSRGLSNLWVYEIGGGVPEPTTWALFILGLGAVGGVMRARKRQIAFAF